MEETVMSIKLPKELHIQLKVLAAKTSRSMTDIVIESIEHTIRKSQTKKRRKIIKSGGKK